MTPKRATVMVDDHGKPLSGGFISHAKHGPITWEVNRPDQWSFELPAGDDQFQNVVGLTDGDQAGISDPLRECILKRGRDCLSWGPVLSPSFSTDSNSISIPGSDTLEYYDRRFVGFVARPNMVNSSPGVDFSGWVHHAADVDTQTSISEDANTFINTTATHPLTGDTALQIHDVSTNQFRTAWLQWDVNFTAVGFERSATFTVEVYVDDAVAFTPNFQKCGACLSTYPLSYGNVFTDFGPTNLSTIDELYPVGPDAEPVRHSVSVTIPPATTGTLVVKLFGVKGDVYYTDPFLDLDNGLIFLNELQTDIAFKLSDHITANPGTPFLQAIQNPNYPYTTDPYGWSDLNIQAPTAVAEPILRTRKYFFSSRTTGLGALSEFPSLDDGFEFWVDYDIASTIKTRHFTTATRRGTDRTNMPLRWGPHGRGNVKKVSWEFKGDSAANAVVETLGGGLGQPEGSAVDFAAYANGNVLAEVARAPQEARPDTLDHRAQYRLDQNEIPIGVNVTIPASPYFEDGLRVGDRVPFAYHEGENHIVFDLLWIKRMTLTPEDDLELQMIRWPGFV